MSKEVKNKILCEVCKTAYSQKYFSNHLKTKKHREKEKPTPKEKYCEFCELKIKLSGWKRHEKSYTHIKNGFGLLPQIKEKKKPATEKCEVCDKQILKKNMSAHKKTKSHLNLLKPPETKPEIKNSGDYTAVSYTHL